ncbi:unnamed protein product [Caenorhabditis auriculariae]|uniref:rhomboid protease n=1 Tax=Caenorhabditis auriculariae TaxID=2777116 RepID=A0A8S1GZR2_9PELO|nr:unnamed protein product [Caenorhabditis auriculariae]
MKNVRFERIPENSDEPPMFSARGKYRRRYREQFEKLKVHPGETEIPLDNLAERVDDANVSLNSAQKRAIREYSADSDRDMVDLSDFESMLTSKRAQPSRMKRIMYDIADPVISESQKVEVRSYIDSYNCFPPPIFILLVTIIEISIFFYYYETDGRGSIWTDCAGCFVHHNHSDPGVLIFVPKLRAEAWRFCSYMLLHSGLNHLIGNMVVQLLVGIPLEVVHKAWRIAPLYILAVVTGSLLQYAVDPNALLVGASAGVYALIMAHVSNVILNWHEMPFRWVRVAVLSTFILFDVCGALYRRFVISQCESISILAHVAGAITGLLFGYFSLYNVVELKWEKIVKWVALGLYTAFLVLTVTMAVVRVPHSKALWEDSSC